MKAGIMNFNFQQTIPILQAGLDPYILFQFKSEISIKTVHLMTPPHTDDQKPTVATKLYIGSIMSDKEDYSQLELVGSWGSNQP